VIRRLFAPIIVPGAAGVKRVLQRGFVVGCRCTTRLDFRTVCFRWIAFRLVTTDPEEETRAECFARRCRTFFGAASAMDPSANTATHESANSFNVLRIMSVKISDLSRFGDTLSQR
jgi:hypothetical protein